MKSRSELQEGIIDSLTRDRIPWMWLHDLPEHYHVNTVIHGVSCFDTNEPVILRGSRFARAARYRSYVDQYDEYIDRAARMFRLNIFNVPGEWQRKDHEIFKAIEQRANKLYPQARKRSICKRYIDGKRVDVFSDDHNFKAISTLFVEASKILKTLDEAPNVIDSKSKN